MTVHGRWRALSAVVATLGLTGVVVLAAAPVISAGTTASAASSPGDIIEGDAGPPWEEDPEPVVTVTITQEPEPVVTKTITEEPEPVVTKTITKEPEPERPAQTQPVPRVTQRPVTENPVDLPTGGFPTPDPVPSPSPAVEEGVSLAPATPPQYPDATAQPTAPEQQQPTLSEETSYAVPIELRQAPPEYDQLSWSRKLAIPGIVLVLLVVLAVLILHGRLQRMAHAAAVRHAGPRPPGRHRESAADYAAETAYPQVVFVPVQAYPGYQPGSPVDPAWTVYGDPGWGPAGPTVTYPAQQPVAEYWTEPPAPPAPPASAATPPPAPWPGTDPATQPDDITEILESGRRRPKPGRRRKNQP